jgi:hypothetical protein
VKPECQVQFFVIAQGVLTVRQNLRPEILLCMKCMARILEMGRSEEKLKKVNVGT